MRLYALGKPGEKKTPHNGGVLMVQRLGLGCARDVKTIGVFIA